MKPLRCQQVQDPLRDASESPGPWKLRLQTSFGMCAKRAGADSRLVTWAMASVRESPPGPVTGPVRG